MLEVFEDALKVMLRKRFQPVLVRLHIKCLSICPDAASPKKFHDE